MSNLYRKKANFTGVTIVLIVLLVLRIFSHVVLIGDHYSFVIQSILYSIALVGVLLRKKFGGLVAIIVAVIDLIFGITIVSSYGIIPVISYSLLIIFFGYKDSGAVKISDSNVMFDKTVGHSMDLSNGKSVSRGFPPTKKDNVARKKRAKRKSLTHCPFCGLKVDSSLAFCEDCGESLA
ncbi:MAG: hypothetical protein ACTSYA_13635 [Candidatus Kariarchaeaceae archaeon]